MAPNAFEPKILFAKSMPVTVSDRVSGTCRLVNLLVTMEWKSTQSTIPRQDLLITLTDNDDPFFIHNLQLTDEDFKILKSEQNIIVDFFTFPQVLIGFLERILSQNPEGSKYTLYLSLGEGDTSFQSSSKLEIVETNHFKKFYHLSLVFLKATDASIKKDVTTSHQNLKNENEVLKSQISILEADIEAKVSLYEGNIKKLTAELESVRRELTQELSLKETRHSKELQEERERFMNKHRAEQHCMDAEQKMRGEEFRNKLQAFEQQVSHANALIREVQNRNHKLEESLDSMRSKLNAKESDFRRITESNQRNKEEIRRLKAELEERNQQLNSQRKTIEEVEASVREKDIEILECKAEMRRLKRELEKKETMAKELKNVTAGKNKADEIILKYIKQVEDMKQMLYQRAVEVQMLGNELKKNKKKNGDNERFIEELTGSKNEQVNLD